MGKLNIEEEKPNPKPNPNFSHFSHFSHEHPLELTALCEADHMLCSGCKTEIVPGRNYYTCRACDYSLHHACFNMPTSLQHPADPNHDLDLLLLASFHCNACGFPGSGFSYSCSVCPLHYHSSCAQLPQMKLHSMHPHTLELEFSPPYGHPKAFRCDVCGTPGSDHWLYRCDRCGFDAHLSCAAAAAAAAPKQNQAAYNNVKAIAHQTTSHGQCGYMNNQHQVVDQNHPMNNGNYHMMSSAGNGAPIGSGVTYGYVNNNPMHPGWGYVNQSSGNYQGGYYVGQGGMGGYQYHHRPNIDNNQAAGGGMAGLGMGALVVAGIGTGIGEATGKEIFDCFTGHSDQNGAN